MKNIRGVLPIAPLFCLIASVWMLLFPCMSSAEGEPKFTDSNAQRKCSIAELPANERENLFPWELLKDKSFKKMYVLLLKREHLNEHWLHSLNGPALKNRLLNINEKNFIYVRSCKSHECDTYVIHLLFSADAKLIYGRLVENDSIKWLGSPLGCIKEAIEMFAHK